MLTKIIPTLTCLSQVPLFDRETRAVRTPMLASWGHVQKESVLAIVRDASGEIN